MMLEAADRFGGERGRRLGARSVAPDVLPTYLAAFGDVADPLLMSGTPFNFFHAGNRAGLLAGGLPTSRTSIEYRVSRLLWVGGRAVSGQRPTGFTFSPAAVKAVWSRVRVKAPCRILNCYQMYPPRILEDTRVSKWFFIDQTLDQLFAGYDSGNRVSHKLASRVKRLEQQGYRSADGIIVHSQWAADSVVNLYQIDARKVHVTPQGANLDEALLERWHSQRQSMPQADQVGDGLPLRLVFVGVEWERKGLDRLLGGVVEARAKGARVELTVVGLDPASVPAEFRAIPGVVWTGFIDKRREQQRFIDVVASHDVGCLLSRNEAGGIGLREYHALGLAVLGTTAGGAAEQTLPAATVLVPADAKSEDIAAEIVRLDKERVALQRMQEASRRVWRDMMWSATVRKIMAFWPSV